MLNKRLLSGAILIGVIIVAVFVKWFFNIAIILFIGMGLYEFFTMLEKKSINIYKYVGVAIGIIIPASIIFRFETTKGWELLFIISVLLFLFMMQFKRRQHSGVTVGISTTIFGILYISWCLSFLIKIRYLDNGIGLFVALMLITKLGDIGAYLLGSRFGKTPLIPHISPKKSVEGAAAGLAFSVMGAFISKPLLGFSYIHLAALGICLGVLGQLGDLSESLIKRDCEVKDSGNILPGMGGILDEIDSLLFTAPAFYFYIIIISR